MIWCKDGDMNLGEEESSIYIDSYDGCQEYLSSISYALM